MSHALLVLEQPDLSSRDIREICSQLHRHRSGAGSATVHVLLVQPRAPALEVLMDDAAGSHGSIMNLRDGERVPGRLQSTAAIACAN